MSEECNIENCEEKFMSKLAYYKLTLRGFLIALSMISVFVVSIVIGSYSIGEKIATLNVKVESMDNKIEEMDKKVDEILDKPKNVYHPDNISVQDVLNYKNPELSAICKND